MVATSHDVMLDIELYQPTDEANALALARTCQGQPRHVRARRQFDEQRRNEKGNVKLGQHSNIYGTAFKNSRLRLALAG